MTTGMNDLMLLSDAGTEAASFTLFREHFNPAVVARFTVDGEPVSKARPRFNNAGSKTRTYTPEKTLQAEQAVGWAFRQTAKGHRLDPDATYGVVALFFAGTRQRRDVDNMVKLILDGLNKVAWPDDDQVVEISGRKSFVPRDQARTEVVVYRVGSVDRPTVTCEHCGRTVRAFHSQASRRFCSQTCHLDWRRSRRSRTCKNCGKAFEADGPATTVKYCSAECYSESRRAVVTCTACSREFTKQRCHVRKTNYCSVQCKAQGKRDARRSAAKGVCDACGGPVSKKSYSRCAACRSAIDGHPRPVVQLVLPVQGGQQ